MNSTALRRVSLPGLWLALTLGAAIPALASSSHGSSHSSGSHASHGSSHHSSGTHSGTHTGTTHGGTTTHTAHPRPPADGAKHPSSGSHPPHAHSSPTVPRDAHGRIERSEAAKHQFEVQSGYPHGRPGYVVDHITPLACGGADAPSNMQWQTVEEAKAKDKTERRGCR